MTDIIRLCGFVREVARHLAGSGRPDIPELGQRRARAEQSGLTELATLFTAARTALFAQNIEEGEPELALTVAAITESLDLAFSSRKTDQFGGSGIAAVAPWLSLGLAHTIAVIGVLSVVVLALRPEFSPKPECHQRRDPRYEAGGEGYWF